MWAEDNRAPCDQHWAAGDHIDCRKENWPSRSAGSDLDSAVPQQHPATDNTRFRRLFTPHTALALQLENCFCSNSKLAVAISLQTRNMKDRLGFSEAFHWDGLSSMFPPQSQINILGRLLVLVLPAPSAGRRLSQCFAAFRRRYLSLRIDDITHWHKQKFSLSDV